MSVYDHRCSDCAICPTCGDPAWCEGDRILVVPCEHKGLCGSCNLGPAGCHDCALEAEAEMHASGKYSPVADPFVRPERFAADAAYWESRPREVPGSPGTFRYPSKETP